MIHACSATAATCGVEQQAQLTAFKLSTYTLASTFQATSMHVAHMQDMIQIRINQLIAYQFELYIVEYVGNCIMNTECTSYLLTSIIGAIKVFDC